MQNIKTHNAIAKVGLDKLDTNLFKVSYDAQNPVGIILRSYKLQTEDFGNSLQAIARAGAGVNNVPVEECSKQGIDVAEPAAVSDLLNRQACFA